MLWFTLELADLVSFVDELLEIPLEKINLEKENISGTKAAEKRSLLPSVLSLFPCNTSSFLFSVYNYSCQKLVYHKFLNLLNTDRKLTERLNFSLKTQPLCK